MDKNLMAGLSPAYALTQGKIPMSATLDMLKNKFGYELSTGPKGTILLFNPNTIHGSSYSSQDFSRRILILTFNSCDNTPSLPLTRPDYLCSNNFTPIKWKI